MRLMSELARMGIVVTRGFVKSATQLAGVTVASRESTELALTLAAPLALHASFSREGLGTKLVKLFRQELQTGDPVFDSLVYVSTATPEVTGALLDDGAVRRLIGRLIADGGALEVNGATMKVLVAGHRDDDPPEVVALVQALVG